MDTNKNIAAKNIMLLSDRVSVIVSSIEKKIMDLKHNPIMAQPVIDQLEKEMDKASLYVVYLPVDISDDMMACLVYLTDHAFRDNKNVLLIGDGEMKNMVISKLLSMEECITWINRPLKMDELEHYIEKKLKEKPMSKSSKRILIVDDDPDFCKMIKSWLRDYKVFAVTSGAQALTFLSRNEPDLILLDYEMPVVDGPQVFQMIRNEDATEKIPVMFLTGVGDKESVQKVLSLKPQGYILKSTTREDLLVTLKEFFNK